MKVHYINILLFAHALNISVSCPHKRNPSMTAHHTPKIPTTRLLCECELYAPANYDNDPQMKRVMEQFEDRTTQRFHEYDDRMVEKRKQCKDRCDKEIQKIILKDKLEKELMDKFTTLQTDIQNEAIPTCICEKSIADKVEKGCLRCGGILGAAMPELGAMGAMALYALNALKPKAIEAATQAAIAQATKAATKAGVQAVRHEIINFSKFFFKEDGVFNLTPIANGSTYNNVDALVKIGKELFSGRCTVPGRESQYSFCTSTIYDLEKRELKKWVQAGITEFDKTLASQKGALEATKVGAVKATYASYETAIIASVIAIVVIIMIMVIIYLILRYRRKKKMKKKLQYIKLLEE
ncbi:PIR protein [Plasmodium sp. DRC-Itaito]|nr:PIR protein [Plasmodium sp. DRC-Itaito]